jgi:hypothetical protein
VSARHAQLTPRHSTDSGYHSQHFPSPSSTTGDDSSSVWESSIPSDSQQAQYPLLPFEQHVGGRHLADKSDLRTPWSPASTQSHDLPVDVSFSLPASQHPIESRHFSKPTHSNQDLPFNQSHTPSLKPQFASSRKCGNQSHLLFRALEFCSPHALPSECWAAHTEMELIGPSCGPIVCPNCNATKLHHLASMAQTTELRHFKKFLYAHLSLLGQCDIYGNSCLHFAAGSGASLAQLEALADAGVPKELSNDVGQTFLHVLNIKRYNSETLPPILQWALQEEGAMTKRDFRNRTVWHCIFQHGISPDMFCSILPCLYRNKDDMVVLDSEYHTPLDCLKSYWRRTGEEMAIDYLNLLQSSGCLPLYAANRTLPLGDVISAGAVAKLATIPEISSNVSRLTIGTPTKRHDPNESTKNGVKGLLSTYKNGGTLECNTIMSSALFCPQPTWLQSTSPLPSRLPEKARMVLFGT